MHFTGLYWFRLSFMGGFAKYFPVELDMIKLVDRIMLKGIRIVTGETQKMTITHQDLWLGN